MYHPPYCTVSSEIIFVYYLPNKLHCLDTQFSQRIVGSHKGPESDRMKQTTPKIVRYPVNGVLLLDVQMVCSVVSWQPACQVSAGYAGQPSGIKECRRSLRTISALEIRKSSPFWQGSSLWISDQLLVQPESGHETALISPLTCLCSKQDVTVRACREARKISTTASDVPDTPHFLLKLKQLNWVAIKYPDERKEVL